MFDFVKENRNSYESFSSFDEKADTYYIEYSKSKHLGGVLESFGLEELSDIKRMLELLWERDTETKKFIPFILAEIKEMDLQNNQNVLSEVELYNYTM